jgi:hypothetical protein
VIALASKAATTVPAASAPHDASIDAMLFAANALPRLLRWP